MQISERRSHSISQLGHRRTDQWEFRHLAVTDVGRERPLNEDFFVLHPDRDLYLVADGMGGHAAGEVASRVAAETVAAYFDSAALPASRAPSRQECDALSHHLVQAIKVANASIFEEAADRRERRGMGTTLVALTFCGDHAYWAHVGDSRLYRLRDQHLTALTRDHSLLEQTLAQQPMTDAEARELSDDFPYKNVLTRALGTRYVVEVDVANAPLEDEDLFVLTTDGVHDTIGDHELRRLLIRHRGDLRAGCEEVVVAANLRGGPDNITIACIEAHRG